MQEYEGIWWTANQNKVTGKLTITDENQIILTTYEKLYDSNTICGFTKGKEITLINIKLDRTNIYIDERYTENSIDYDTNENKELKYCLYKYVAEIAIFGNAYERKGDIRIKAVSLYYTNLEQWIDWKVNKPEISLEKHAISLKIKRFNEKIIQTEEFDLIIGNPYRIGRTQYKVNIDNQAEIIIRNIKNEYIKTIQGIVEYMQSFLILCIGDNINIEEIDATDLNDRKIKIILNYGKSNYENRSIFKDIIKYKDIENNIENIMKSWINVYEENELLIANFTKLQTEEEPLISEYINLMSTIDSLHLLITKKEQSKEPFVEVLKKLLRETNFILNLSDKEMEELAIKIKDIRRYFVHSNKTQKELVYSNISMIILIVNILIEIIRSRIMIEIGIDKNTIKNYYKNIEKIKDIKYDIINNINKDEEIISERLKDGKKVMNPLSKKDRENIAELNAMLGTKYQEVEFNLENSKDLIKAIENTTAEYMDYNNYEGKLDDLLEKYDQSIEVFHPEKTFNMLVDENTEDNIYKEVYSDLYSTYCNMCELTDMYQEKCKELWQYMLLGNDKKAQDYFVGDISKYKKEKILEALENTIENIDDIYYENVITEDAQNFSKKLKKYLENG